MTVVGRSGKISPCPPAPPPSPPRGVPHKIPFPLSVPHKISYEMARTEEQAPRVERALLEAVKSFVMNHAYDATRDDQTRRIRRRQIGDNGAELIIRILIGKSVPVNLPRNGSSGRARSRAAQLMQHADVREWLANNLQRLCDQFAATSEGRRSPQPAAATPASPATPGASREDEDADEEDAESEGDDDDVDETMAARAPQTPYTPPALAIMVGVCPDMSLCGAACDSHRNLP